MNYINECLQLFNNLPENIKSIVGGEKTVQIADNIEKKYKVDVSFLIILIAIGELEINAIPTYLIAKFKVSKEQAEEIASLLSKEVFSASLAKSKPVVTQDNEEVIVDDLKNIFSSGLKEAFASNFDDQDFLNAKIIYLITANENLNEEILLKILFDNHEQLTGTPILLEGKKTIPTVANWIKDFIKNLGTDLFDNISMTKYLTASINCKSLDGHEKDLVKKLLLLYRNLKFFPISQTDLDPDNWEIIPEDRERDVKERYNKPLSIPKSGEEKRIEDLTGTKLKVESKLAKKAIEEEIDGTKKIDDLKIMANKYKDNSLQKRAIEEEIKKLAQK